jgi:hypothetical protein
MSHVATGKRVGARAARPKLSLNPLALGIGAGITLCVIAWGYLVYAAIDFGTAGRSGTGSAAWGLMALAALGAMACLFAGLMMGAWLLRVLGITSAPEGESDLPAPPRAPGGKRIAR